MACNKLSTASLPTKSFLSRTHQSKLDFHSTSIYFLEFLPLNLLFINLEEGTSLTFHDAITSFPVKWRLRNDRRNSILMTRHYPDLSSASDWLRHDQSEALQRSGKWHVIGMELLHSYLRRHFAGKLVMALWNVGCFLKVGGGGRGEESPPLTMMTVDPLDRGSLFLQLSTLVTSQTSRICAVSPDEVP